MIQAQIRLHNRLIEFKLAVLKAIEDAIWRHRSRLYKQLISEDGDDGDA